LSYKKHAYPLSQARATAIFEVQNVEFLERENCAKLKDEEDLAMVELLEDVSYKIIRQAAIKELIK
jgi:hypothetical protein